MPSISLSSHTIRVRQVRRPDAPSEKLGSIGGEENVFDFVLGFLKSLKSSHRHDANAQCLQNVSQLNFDETQIWGLLHYGEYGFEATGVSVATLEKSYERSVEDAEMVPFFFLFDLPKDSTKGILILQRLGSRGVQTQLVHALRSDFREQYPDYIMEINPHAPGEMINYLKEGELRRMTLTTYDPPRDIADRMGLAENHEKTILFTVTATAEKDGWLPLPGWVRPAVVNKNSIYEIRDASDLPDDVTLTMRLGGKERTFNFARLEKVTPHLDVTGRVAQAESGHPVFSSITRVAKELALDLATEIGRRM